MNENRELLFSQDYNIQGQTVVFNLYRSENSGQVEMDLAYQFQMPGAEETICKKIFFPVDAEAYQSPYLSWYNLICCSNNYGPIPVVSYMNYAVQNGKKIAATVYPETVMEYNQLLRDSTEGFYCFPYHFEEYQYMLYISRTGKLADYFNLEEILNVYESCGINLDKVKMDNYFAQELSWFANENVCPIEIHNCLGDEELAIVGLLFGYPVESTVALINKTIDMME